MIENQLTRSIATLVAVDAAAVCKRRTQKFQHRLSGYSYVYHYRSYWLTWRLGNSSQNYFLVLLFWGQMFRLAFDLSYSQ